VSYGPRMISRIAVGVDGSDGSQHALRWAAELAKALDAHVLAVHVVPEGWLLELNAIQLKTDALVADRRAKLLGEWTEVLRDQGVAYSTELVHGHLSTELGRRAEELHADLIVVGGRHTAHRVANHCKSPVVVVPEPGGEPEVPIPG
jgi:nucleotide-binding universal stress UspA family protein